MADNAVCILLGLLAHEPMSGYDLKKRVEASVGRFWDLGYGQIYPSLKEMERTRLVTAEPGRTGKGPERIVYRITDAGKDRLHAWVQQPGERENFRFETMLKLFFGGALGPEENIRRVDAFRERHQQELTEILQFKESLEGILQGDHLYFYLTVLFGEKLHRASVEWADAARELLTGRMKEKGESSHDQTAVDP